MIRKFLLAAVAALGLLSPLAVTAADAHEFRPAPRYVHHERREYRVFYNDPCRPGWSFGGCARGHREAERLAEQYRCKGFAVSIR
jgi:hypothetical protein